ncbi:hypothetical protein, partial [Streptomyces mirabilis]|uniref:hypothetical protein n=1 Tax=Streptomyces mirabilis TaxID=68239 RepID=UPI0036A5F015
ATSPEVAVLVGVGCLDPGSVELRCDRAEFDAVAVIRTGPNTDADSFAGASVPASTGAVVLSPRCPNPVPHGTGPARVVFWVRCRPRCARRPHRNPSDTPRP